MNPLHSPITTILANGVSMPLLGIGSTHTGGFSEEAMVSALRDHNCRLIDTAKRYGVEERIGLSLSKSGVPRRDVFLITKLWPTDFGYETTLDAFRQSARRLGTSYLDCYMVHFPTVPDWMEDKATEMRSETWRALETLNDEGLCRCIGVSNYQESDLEELMDYAGTRPHINQNECHPYQNPKALRRYCHDHQIQFMGYCPLAKGTILQKPPIVDVAERLSRTPAQILIRWCVQQGIPTVPKTTKVHRIQENMQVFDFHIPDSEMSLLNDLHDGRRLVSLHNVQARMHWPDGYKLIRYDTTAMSSPPIVPPGV